MAWQWRRWIQKHLIWVFAFALLMTLAPLSYYHIFLESSITLEEQTARVLNVSGRQRMLSQRMTLFADRLVSEVRENGSNVEEYRQTLSNDLDLFRRSQDALMYGSEEIGVPPIRSDMVANVYFDEPVNLEETAQFFIDDLEFVLSLSPDEMRQPIPALERVQELGPTVVLRGLNDAVTAFERSGELAIRSILEREKLIWTFTLVILALEFLLIFLPVHRLIRSQVGRLESNERLFRSFYENSPIMLHSIDRDAKLLNVSNFWLRTLGYKREEVIGRPVYEFMTPFSQKMAQEVYLPEFYRRGVLEDTEYQFVTKNGEVLEVQLSAQAETDGEGQFLRSFAAMVDVTHERKLQKELEKNADALNQFIRTASLSGLSIAERIRAVLRFGNVFFDTSLAIVSRIEGADYTVLHVAGSNAPPPQGTVLDADTTYCKNLLTSGETVAIQDVSRSSFATSPSYETFGLDTYIGAPLEVGGEFFGSIAFTAENPRPEPFDRVDRAFMKLLSQWVAATIEQDLARQQLDEAKMAAELANATKSSFLANMSHEIRTPLNAVIGLTELVMRTDMTEQQRRYMSRVAGAGKSLLGVINDILDFSKIEAGKLQIENVAFELDDVLQNLGTVISDRVEESDLEVIVWVDPEMPAVIRGDPLRLGQVLINLVGNALKFTETGEIIVRADIIGADDDDEAAIAFSVRDTGIGMSEAVMEQLFKPFMQADESTTRAFGGTGLGLSISKQLVEGMGGTIQVESTPGEGSTFTFTVPLIAVADEKIDKPVRRIDPTTVNIMVVDDSPTACELISAALESMRFKVEVYRSGSAAVKRIDDPERPVPDVILLDWKMPGMDGLETAARIRDLGERGRSPKICMISAYNLEEFRSELRDYDIRTTLSKPLNTSVLLDELMVTLGGDLDSLSHKELVRKTADEEVRAVRSGIRVLLAEDNSLNQMVAVGILERAGFVVDVADSGLAAVDKIMVSDPPPYDAVLMDIQMPVMHGLTATRVLRREIHLKEFPIIAMTAHAMVEEREKCFAAGMNDHVSKPVDPRDLVSKLNYWVESTPIGGGEKRTAPDDFAVAEAPASRDDDYDPDEAIDRLMIPRETYLKFVEEFVEKYSEADATLRGYLDSADRDDAIEYAHMIKGVSSTLGARKVSDLAARIEHALKNENFSASSGEIEPMVAEFSMALKTTIAKMVSVTSDK